MSKVKLKDPRLLGIVLRWIARRYIGGIEAVYYVHAPSVLRWIDKGCNASERLEALRDARWVQNTYSAEGWQRGWTPRGREVNDLAFLIVWDCARKPGQAQLDKAIDQVMRFHHWKHFHMHPRKQDTRRDPWDMHPQGPPSNTQHMRQVQRRAKGEELMFIKSTVGTLQTLEPILERRGLEGLRAKLYSHPHSDAAWLARELWRAMQLPMFELALPYCNTHGQIEPIEKKQAQAALLWCVWWLRL